MVHVINTLLTSSLRDVLQRGSDRRSCTTSTLLFSQANMSAVDPSCKKRKRQWKTVTPSDNGAISFPTVCPLPFFHPHFFASHCYWMLPNASVFQQTAVLTVYAVSIQLYMYVWSCVKTLLLHVLLIAHTWLCILKDISDEWDHAKNKCVMCTLCMLWFGFVFQSMR